MRFCKMGALVLFVSALFVGPNDASAKTSYLPPLPFEKYFAQRRGDADVLKFNDFSGKIKSQRIKKLLRSGPVLGDRVLLHNNTAVYFPEGYIVSATARFDKWRVKGESADDSNVAVAKEKLELNPDYEIVQAMERYLGKTCAEAKVDDLGNVIRVRKNNEGILSLVQRVKGRYDHIVGDTTHDVIVTSAMDPTYLSADGSIRALAAGCL